MVELKNISSDSIVLDGWYLTDKLGRKFALQGSLNSKESKKFKVRNSSAESMQLGNSGGRIVLYQPNGEIEASVYYNKAQTGETITFS